MNLKHKLIKITAGVTLLAFTFSGTASHAMPQAGSWRTVPKEPTTSTTVRDVSAVFTDVRSELRDYANQFQRSVPTHNKASGSDINRKVGTALTSDEYTVGPSRKVRAELRQFAEQYADTARRLPKTRMKVLSRSELRGGSAAATYLSAQEELSLLYSLLTHAKREKQNSGSGQLPYVAVISDQHGTISRFDALIADAINQAVPGKLPADFKLNPDKTLQDQLAVHDITFDVLRGKVYFHNLGDLMDRGPYGVKVFRRSAELIDAGFSDFVPGNHDLWMFMNLQGFHLPFYDGYNFYGDIEAELAASRYRKEIPEANTKTWWAKHLAEFTAYHEKRQKEHWDAFEIKVNGEWTDAKRKKRVEGSGLYKQVSASLNGDAEKTKLWNQFRGWYLVDVYTGVRAVGAVSIAWWEELLEGFEKAYASIEAAQGFNAELPSNQAWREAIRMMSKDILPELKKDLQSFVDQGKDWAKVFEAINRQNYTSPEWWAKDWVFHKDWGTSVIKELNENMPSDAKVTSANYLENHTLDRIADFYKAQFHLYQRDIYQNIYMHAFLPVDMQTGEFFFTYKGVEYRGKGSKSHPSVWQGLDIVARDIRDNPSLSEIYEALNLVNSWYADNTTVIKVPNVAAAINKFGAQKLAAVNGFNRLFTGHLPFHEFATKLNAEKRGVIGGFQIDSRIIFTDQGMGERFGGRGGWIGVSLENGIQLRGFEHSGSSQIVADARTVETKEGPDGPVEVVLFENVPVGPDVFAEQLVLDVQARIEFLQPRVSQSARIAVYKEYLKQFSVSELQSMLDEMTMKRADLVNYLQENLAHLDSERQNHSVTEFGILNEHISILQEAINAVLRSELRQSEEDKPADPAMSPRAGYLIAIIFSGLMAIAHFFGGKDDSKTPPANRPAPHAPTVSEPARSELRQAGRNDSVLNISTWLDLSIYKDVLAFVHEQAGMLGAGKVEVIDASDDDRLLAEEVAAGKLIALPDGNFYTRSHPEDVARSEDKTFVATHDEKDKGLFNNWRHTDEIKPKIQELMKGSLEGRTLYAIPYLMGPANSPFSQVGVELTDSRYVALNMIRMTRVGKIALDEIKVKGKFTRGIHVTGDLDQLAAERKADPKNDQRHFASFPDENLILSYGSAYGGNALLGKKFHSLRQAMYDAHKEGWLAEHMFTFELEDMQTGEIKRVAGAYPSASGKTNAAMMRVVKQFEGRYKIKFFSDDIIWLRPGKDGRLWAINAERGLFGVVPGTNGASNPNAMEAISKSGKTIFTNVAYNEITGKLWWEGHDLPRPDEESGWRNWKGELIANLPPERKNEAWAHPNSRFTTSIDNVANLSPNWENPEGVPIDIILFGGRVGSREPLIRETRSIEEGVYDGLTMGVETTAAASGAVGVLRDDPMAQRPFFSINEGDYAANWIKVLRSVRHPPKIFHVNWFRKGSDSKFLWPGYGENLRAILWAFERAAHPERTDNIISTPFGNIPAPNALNMDGLHMDSAKLQELLSIDETAWTAEIMRRTAWLTKFVKDFPGRMPKEILAQHEKLVKEWTRRLLENKFKQMGVDIEALARAESAKRTPIIGGNWKMAVNKAEDAINLVRAIVEEIRGIHHSSEKTQIVIAPSFIDIDPIAQEIQRIRRDTMYLLEAQQIILGVQDISAEEPGAHTSQISYAQAKDRGVQYVIIGHSERRHGNLKKPADRRLTESDGVINDKVKIALKNDLKVILAVGELLEERDLFKTFDVIERQVREGLKDVTAEQMANVVIAYEPVWAIGTGKTATPEQADEVHRFIRALFLSIYGENIAAAARIQYGGSMNPKNVASLIAQKNIDGGLIGGASLKADEFTAIIKAANDSARSELRVQLKVKLKEIQEKLTTAREELVKIQTVPAISAVIKSELAKIDLAHDGLITLFNIENPALQNLLPAIGNANSVLKQLKNLKLAEGAHKTSLMAAIEHLKEAGAIFAGLRLADEQPDQPAAAGSTVLSSEPLTAESIILDGNGNRVVFANKEQFKHEPQATEAFLTSAIKQAVAGFLNSKKSEGAARIEVGESKTLFVATFKLTAPGRVEFSVKNSGVRIIGGIATVKRSELRSSQTALSTADDDKNSARALIQLLKELLSNRLDGETAKVIERLEALSSQLELNNKPVDEIRAELEAMKAAYLPPAERSELRTVNEAAFDSLNPIADTEEGLNRLGRIVRQSVRNSGPARRSELREAIVDSFGLGTMPANSSQAKAALIALPGLFEYGPLIPLIQQNLPSQFHLIVRPSNRSELRVIETINQELIAGGFRPVAVATNDRELMQILRETRSELRYALGTTADTGTAQVLFARGILQSPNDLITPTSRQFDSLTGLAGLTADIMNRYRAELRTSMAA